MSITLTVDYATSTWSPTQEQFQQWIKGALKEFPDAELAIKIIDEQEMQALNAAYRNKDKPTNVLSFSCQLPPSLRGAILGDIAICAPVVLKEAKAQNKTLEAHWAHLIIHGVLHLLGYDHETESEAQIMEDLEIQHLKDLGFNDPYTVEIHHE